MEEVGYSRRYGRLDTERKKAGVEGVEG